MNEWALGNQNIWENTVPTVSAVVSAGKRFTATFLRAWRLLTTDRNCNTITMNEIARQALDSLSFLASVFLRRQKHAPSVLAELDD
jgi:hypothetical protein